jgi:hypothetical protein
MSKKELCQELIEILKSIRKNIKDDAECIWSYYENPRQAHNEIDKYIIELETENISSLSEIQVHFAPTSAYQELAMQNGWSDDYMKLATKFDIIDDKLKNCS